MLSEIKYILARLQEETKVSISEDIYEDIVLCMEKILDHLFRHSVIKKEVKETMKGKIFELPSDIRRREIEEAEARKEANITEDILTVGPLIKENKDDTDIAQITGWTHEKIAKYRRMLSFM